MAQEFQAKPLAFGGARDQTRHIRDGVPVIAGHDHAEIRHQRGERVIGDFRLGGAHCCNQAGFARRGEANERDVRNGLKLEDDIAFLTRLTKQGEARSATRTVRQRGVAEPACTARSGDEPVPHMSQIRKQFAGTLRLALGTFRGENHRTDRYRQNQVLAFRTIFRISQAHGAAVGRAVGNEPVIQQAVRVLIRHKDDGTAVAAIAAVGAGKRLVFLAPDACGAVAPVAALDMDGHPINKICHSVTLRRPTAGERTRRTGIHG